MGLPWIQQSLLQHASKIVELFNDKLPITSMSDPRLKSLNAFYSFMNDWRNDSTLHFHKIVVQSAVNGPGVSSNGGNKAVAVPKCNDKTRHSKPGLCREPFLPGLIMQWSKTIVPQPISACRL